MTEEAAIIVCKNGASFHLEIKIVLIRSKTLLTYL
jgi:hypothetical protein